MLNVIRQLRRSTIKLGFGALLAVAAVYVSPASALPVFPMSAAERPVTQVKIICEPDGTCFRAPRRRPVARWIYGDKTFSGPYVGPGNYGNPATHWRKFPYFYF